MTDRLASDYRRVGVGYVANASDCSGVTRLVWRQLYVYLLRGAEATP
jgi:hypothetical protein